MKKERATAGAPGTDQFVGVSHNYLDIKNLIDKYAKTDLNVLIIGDTGTGKELIARQLHDKSGRSGQFEPINATSIPYDLFDSLLYGHIKGSFSGAYADQVGHAEIADNGTLFIDEIGKLLASCQGKLLRFIDDKKITPIGGKSKPVKVRLITALKPDERKDLLPDLDARLREVEIRPDPLNKRPEDTIAILHYYKSDIDPRIKAHIYSSDLPGNVRDLKNYCHKGYDKEVAPFVDEKQKKYFADMPDNHIAKFLIEYEICVLKSAGVPNNRIAKILHCRRNLLTTDWQNNYHINLDDFIKKHGAIRCKFFPDFIDRISIDLLTYALGVHQMK